MLVLLLFCLFTVTLGQAPRCELARETIEMNQGSVINERFICSIPPTSISISPLLPAGINADVNGIAGNAQTPLSKTTYTITFLNSAGSSYRLLSLLVWGSITYCDYGLGSSNPTVSFMVGMRTGLVAPKCNADVKTFSITKLPSGLEIDAKTGAISGIAQTVTPAQYYIAKATNPYAVEGYEFIIRISVIAKLQENMNRGLYVQFSKDGSGDVCPQDYVTAWNNFDNGNLEYTSARLQDFTKTWSPNQQTSWNPTGNKANLMNYYSRTTAFIRIPLAGLYNFSFVADDCMGVFIDDFNAPVSVIRRYYDTMYFAVTLTPGLHQMGLLHLQKDGPHGVKVSWKMPQLGINTFTLIANEYLFIADEPIQYLSYSSNDIIMNVGSKQVYSPRVSGTVSSWSLEGKLPPGVTFETDTGKFSNPPTSSNPRTKYIVTAKNKMGSVTYDLWITVAEQKTSSMSPGIVATYYKWITAGRPRCGECPDPLNVPTDVTNGIVKVDRNLSYTPIEGVRPGLSEEYYDRYSISWGGTIDIPADGRYSFYVETDYSSAYFGLGGQYLIVFNTGCETRYRKQVDITLQSGPKSLGLFYAVPASTTGRASGITVSWSGGPDQMPIQEIPSSRFFYIPTRSFFYSFPIATYTSGQPIENNLPSLYNATFAHKFSVAPNLPSGLSLDRETGIISGTPAVTQSPKSEYTITATPIKTGNTYTTVVAIDIHSYTPPKDLQYKQNGNLVNTVKGRINEKIQDLVASVITVGTVGVKFSVSPDLPSGLILNSATGTISGTPTQVMSNVAITIAASQLGAPTTYVLTFNIDPCENDGKLVEFLMYAEQPTVSVNVTDSTKVLFAYGIPETTYKHEQFCIPTAEDITFTMTANAKLPPTYYIYGEGLAIKQYDILKPGNSRAVFKFKSEGGPSLSFSYAGGANKIEQYRYMVIREAPKIANSFAVKTFSYVLTRPTIMPSTIQFNQTTGEFTGEFTEVNEYVFTITARTVKGVTATCTVTFVITACPNAAFYLSMLNNNEARQVQLKLKKEDSDTYLLDYDGLIKYYQHKWTFCDSLGSYIITSGPNRWLSYLSVSLAQGYELLYFKHSTNLVVDTKFSIENDVPPQATWKYSNTYSAGWNTASFSDSSWAEANPGTFPERTTTTRYYRVRFDTSVTLSTIAVFVSAFTYDAGIAAYMNGVRYYVRNLPKSFGDTTLATRLYNTIRSRTASGPVSLLQTNNVLAVETHKFETSLPVDQFSGFVELLPANSDGCLPRTTIKVSTSSEISATGDLGPISLTDGDPNTKYVVTVNEKPGTWINFLFPDGNSEYFNSYYVTSGDKYRESDPMTWELYGTQDGGETWEKVHEVSNSFFVGAKHRKDYFMGTTTIETYDGYRWNILKHGSQSAGGNADISAADFIVQSCNIKACPSLPGWDASPIGKTLTQACPQFYMGSRTRDCLDMNGVAIWGPDPGMAACELEPPESLSLENKDVHAYVGFSVESYKVNCIGAGLNYELYPTTLPSGVIFNPTTGELVGVPRGNLPNTTFYISCSNDIGDIYVTFTLMSTTPQCPAVAGYPTTAQGLIAKKPCSSGAGFFSRKCSDGTNPTWVTKEEDHCEDVTHIQKEDDTAVIAVSVIALIVIAIVFFTCFYLRCIKGSINKQKHARALGGPKHHRPQTTIHDEGSAVDSGGVRVDGGNGAVEDVKSDGVRV